MGRLPDSGSTTVSCGPCSWTEARASHRGLRGSSLRDRPVADTRKSRRATRNAECPRAWPGRPKRNQGIPGFRKGCSHASGPWRVPAKCPLGSNDPRGSLEGATEGAACLHGQAGVRGRQDPDPGDPGASPERQNAAPSWHRSSREPFGQQLSPARGRSGRSPGR